MYRRPSHLLAVGRKNLMITPILFFPMGGGRGNVEKNGKARKSQNLGGGTAADFGVVSAINTGAGTYVITIRNSNLNFSNSSVTATIRHNDTTNVNGVVQLKPGIRIETDCGRAEATEIGIFMQPNV